MNLYKITNFDTNNGPGFRVSIWFSGCSIKCNGCHNKELWDETKGHHLTLEDAKQVCELLKHPGIAGISLLGGEPIKLHNATDLAELRDFCKYIKEQYPNKSIWLWTGYLVNRLKRANLEVLNYIDVVVDGPYKAHLRDTSLAFRGSSNQTITYLH